MPLDQTKGEPEKPAVNALQDAQKRLVSAAMDQGMQPQGIAFSAYINGMLQSARLTAVIKLLIQARLLPIEAENFDLVEEYLQHLTLEALNTDIIPRLEANKPSRIVAPGTH